LELEKAKGDGKMKINGVLIGSCNYNEHRKQYEFYDTQARITATISSDRIKLPKDNAKAWEKLDTIFGD